ncbi:MAG: hypothetical protein QHJ73_00105, partial [Armatimonadota bacterium]|nr:hypothetical protein [Armatimonadota bacterium]
MRDFTPISLEETPRAFRVRSGTWAFLLSRASGLLEQATVHDDPWLAAPLPDLWASGAVDPRGDAYHARYSPSTTTQVVSVRCEEVVLRSEGCLARVDGTVVPLRWELEYSFAPDGTVTVAVTVRATGRMALRWLSLGRVEADPGSCRFLVHEGDAGSSASSCRPTCHLLNGGGYEAAGRFIPWVHFGNDCGGVDLVFPHSDRGGWSWTDSSPYSTGDPLGRAGDRMLVQASGGRAWCEAFAIRNLYQPVEAGWEYRDTLYLSAVPGKETDPRGNDVRVWWLGPHQYRSGWLPPGEEEVARWAALGANTVIGGVNWRSGDYRHPENPAETARFIDLCHRYGMRVLPYLTFTDLEYGASAFSTHGAAWRIEPVAEFNYRSQLMCYGAEGWQEHWQCEVAAAWEAFPFDGLYIDFWASRLGCRNPRHGCDGPYGRFNAAGLRRMAQFAAGLVRQRDGLIVANCNILPLAMLNN